MHDQPFLRAEAPADPEARRAVAASARYDALLGTGAMAWTLRSLELTDEIPNLIRGQAS